MNICARVGVWGGREWSAKSSPLSLIDAIVYRNTAFLICLRVWLYSSVCVWERERFAQSKEAGAKLERERERVHSVDDIRIFLSGLQSLWTVHKLFLLSLLVTTIRNLDSSGVVLRAYVCKLPLTGSCIGLFSSHFALFSTFACDVRACARYIYFPEKYFAKKVFTLSELHFILLHS